MRRYAYGLGIFVAGFAASYVLIYLYRWEWNRALMSAAFLLVAEVALLGAATLERLKRLETKIDAGRPPERPLIASEAVDGPPEAARSAVVSTPRFAWLAEPVGRQTVNGLPRLPEPGDRFSVFIPVIMGAGLLLSGLAWVVERIARAAVARSSGRQRPARGLNNLALPPGGPFATPFESDEDALAERRSGSRRGVLGKRVALTFGAVAIAGPGVFLLADLTQSRPDPPSPAAATTLTIEVESNRPAADVAERVHRRWEMCRDTTNLSLRTSDLVRLDERRFAGIVTPALGELAYRRLAGCLQDAAVDFVQLRVVAASDID